MYGVGERTTRSSAGWDVLRDRDATLQQFLKRATIDLKALPAVVAKAVRAIRVCRTKVLGGHAARCAHCGYVHYAYHSCRNRHCPQCQSQAADAWVQARQAALLPVRCFHVVFTLPHELNALIAANRRRFLALFFAQVWQTLHHFGRKHLGGKIGVTMVLHTWGQTLIPHVHLHCMVTAGALTDEGQWNPSDDSYLFPAKAVRRWFRRRMLDAVKAEHDQWLLPGDLARWARLKDFNRGLTPLYEKTWTVYFKEPFGGPHHLVQYLARYTHRVAISNHRIERIDRDGVTFRWRDYADDNRVKRMTLGIDTFVHRFLWHVLPKRFVRIRHFGLHANNAREQRNRARQALEAPPENIPTPEDLHAFFERIFRCSLLCCPKCHHMTLVFQPLPEPRNRDPPQQQPTNH